MSDSAWFIGSITIPAYSFDVDGVPVSIAAGTYYLHHNTAALSLLTTIAAAVLADTGFTCTMVLTRARVVRMTLDSPADVDWTGATALRELLGFSEVTYTNLSAQSAENVSALLWSPGYLATPRTIQGVDGYTVQHQSVLKSADGTQVYATHYGEETWQDLSWTHIQPERMRVDSTAGGTFHEFFEQCAGLRVRFLYLETVDEIDGSTTTVSTISSAMGPYVLRPDMTGDWYRRNMPNAEVSSPLELPMHMVSEYA